MDLEYKLLVSAVAGVLNMTLSTVVPCLLKKTNKPLLTNVKTVFSNNKKLILTSSILISLLVFLALTITPELDDGEDINNVKIINLTDLRNFMPRSQPKINSYDISLLRSL